MNRHEIEPKWLDWRLYSCGILFFLDDSNLACYKEITIRNNELPPCV